MAKSLVESILRVQAKLKVEEAAPDLLAALKAILPYAEGCLDGDDERVLFWNPSLKEDIAAAKAAIEKAEGR